KSKAEASVVTRTASPSVSPSLPSPVAVLDTVVRLHVAPRPGHGNGRALRDPHCRCARTHRLRHDIAAPAGGRAEADGRGRARLRAAAHGRPGAHLMDALITAIRPPHVA